MTLIGLGYAGSSFFFNLSFLLYPDEKRGGGMNIETLPRHSRTRTGKPERKTAAGGGGGRWSEWLR